MTRKDYIKIAQMLAAAQNHAQHYYSSNEEGYIQGVKSAAIAVAMVMTEDNPRFDRARFLKACGVAD